MNTAIIDLKKFEYIVIFSNPRGYTERYYVAVPASMSGSMITEYVHECYGRESGQEWRTATPAEREAKEFETADVPAHLLPAEWHKDPLCEGSYILGDGDCPRCSVCLKKVML